MTVRAGVIVISDGKVALIERLRDGEHYFVFPGGSVEPGELAKMTAGREAKEELGLDVEVGPHVATVAGALATRGVMERYFLADAVGGEFGTGSGAEMAKGTHKAVWLEGERLTTEKVLPPSLAAFVQRCIEAGFPAAAADLEV